MGKWWRAMHRVWSSVVTVPHPSRRKYSALHQASPNSTFCGPSHIYGKQSGLVRIRRASDRLQINRFLHLYMCSSGVSTDLELAPRPSIQISETFDFGWK